MIAPKKSLGQNFLHDESSIQKMVDSLDITADDTVVEIGPGRGALTKHLLKADPKKVIAIEKDDRMVTFLRAGFERCVATDTLEVKHGDFLDWEPAKTPFKLIGNIPFYITGRILRHVLDASHHPAVMTLLMQKEVAERIIVANDKNSILGTAVSVYCKPKIIGTVKPGAFFPPPSVMSAIVHFQDFRSPFSAAQERQAFFTFIHRVFAGKRKTLATNLKDHIDRQQITKGLTALGQPANVRAEDLTSGELLELFYVLNPHLTRPQPPERV